jgi:hypothetical protein
MRREPYVPGALPPLAPPRVHSDPVALFDHAELVAQCRRTEALCNRLGFAIAAVGFVAALMSVI